MNQEIWQQLLSLESRDIIQQWFSKIHGRELNARRAKEINAAAKQSREYFRNASNSNYSVRPLLTYYGVASLSRALLLLLRKEGGEESLKSGHGLTTVEWGKILSGDTLNGLSSLLDLRVQTSSGLFSDFVIGTGNRIAIHISSSAVDWMISYDIPDQGHQVSLGDLFSRIPDLIKDYSIFSSDIRYKPVHELSFNLKEFKAKIPHNKYFANFENCYQNMGYKIETQTQWTNLTCDASTLKKNTPLFIHSYIQKTFGSIPNLYIAEPFSNKVRYSQLSVTYMVSYFLGMLARYFPTHWMSLIQGEKGDALWPTINRAQQFVENSYPELVIEMILNTIEENGKKPNN